MHANKAIKLKRLQRQEQQLINDPIANALVKRDGLLNFHFVIYNLDGEYKGGFYHGLLELHENYPFAAPKLYFYTPSGRFELNMPICTSFTNYHQESWTSAWNVRSLLLGTISFMTSDEASYGCRNDSHEVKLQLASKSLAYNLKNPKFRELFLDQLRSVNPPIPSHVLNQYQQPVIQEQSIIKQVPLESDPQMLLPNLNPNQQEGQRQRQANRNQNKRWKIIAACIAVPTIIFICYLALS